MTIDEKRYIWIIAILVSLCFTLLIGLFTSKLDRNYTDEVIQNERVQTHEYVDSTINVSIMPKLDLIIRMIEDENN